MGLDQAIDITTEERKIVLGLIERHLPNTTAWVYGSRAKWTSRPQSDLDLVVFATPEQNGRVSDLREAFEESNLPFRVDLFVRDAVPEQFRKHIKRDHVVLVQREERDAAGGWCATTIGEVLTLQRGFDLPTTERKPGNYLVIASTGPTGTHNEAAVRGPGVVIGRSGSLGGGQFIKHDFWPLNTTLWVKDFKGNNPRFCYFLLKSIDLAQFNVGSGVPTLNRNHVHPLRVSLPPLPEQLAIANILGTLDDKIELNRRMNETLEAMARALFKSWFVDFDPVRAKMAGRDTGLPKHLADLFPDRLVESALGLIPAGWKIRNLAEMAMVIDCLHSRKPKRQHDGPVLIQVFNIGPTGRLDFSDPYHVTEDDYAEWTRRMEVLPGDLVITKTGRVGAIGQMAKGYKAAMGRNMVGVRAISGRSAPRFLQASLLSNRMRREMTRHTNDGTILRSLHVKAISRLREVLPPYDLVSCYEASVDPVHAKLEQNDVESEALAAMRDAFLPKLISGVLRVKDAKTFLDRAL